MIRIFITQWQKLLSKHQDKSFKNTFPKLVREKKIIYSGENMPVINGVSILNYRHCD